MGKRKVVLYYLYHDPYLYAKFLLFHKEISALMKATFVYGCIVYMSAGESGLKQLDVEQAQAF